jgi:hypothetical protein
MTMNSSMTCTHRSDKAVRDVSHLGNPYKRDFCVRLFSVMTEHLHEIIT